MEVQDNGLNILLVFCISLLNKISPGLKLSIFVALVYFD